jgi:hypothetical protein
VHLFWTKTPVARLNFKMGSQNLRGLLDPLLDILTPPTLLSNFPFLAPFREMISVFLFFCAIYLIFRVLLQLVPRKEQPKQNAALLQDFTPIKQENHSFKTNKANSASSIWHYSNNENRQSQVRRKIRFISASETEFLLRFSPSKLERRERRPPVIYSPTAGNKTPKEMSRQSNAEPSN